VKPRPFFLPGPGAQAPDDFPAAGRSPVPGGAAGENGGEASGRSAAGAAAIVPRTEPNWGDLQGAYRVLRSYGYTMVRRRSGAILVDGHRYSPARVRELARRLKAGRVSWQR
jgi:hypothetical protein